MVLSTTKESKDRLVKTWEKSTMPSIGMDENGEPIILQYSMYTTPPFPSIWPLKKEAELHSYAVGSTYCNGMKAQHMISVVARIEMDIHSKIKVSRTLTHSPTYLGRQAVRPCTKKELDVFKKFHNISVEETLIKYYYEDDEENMKKYEKDLADYYIYWSTSNELISTNLRKEHPAFFQWLDIRRSLLTNSY